MNKLNIWLVEVGEHLPLGDTAPKMRTSMLVDKLIERGHEIVWWTSCFDHYKKTWIFKEDTEISLRKGLKIKAIKGCGYGKNFSIRRFLDHRLIARKFKSYSLMMPKPDVIIAASPPYDLAYEAVLFANNNKIPVMVDIRDQWPDVYLHYIPAFLRPIFNIFIARELIILAKALKRATGIIAMMNSLLTWGLKHAGRLKIWKDRVFYLGYCPECGDTHETEKIKNILSSIKDKFVVIFVGSFTVLGSPGIILSCAVKMSGYKNIRFLLIGDGHDYNRLNKLAGHMDNVIVTGRLKPQETAVLLKNSHVGICPMAVNLDIFGNKTFAYLAHGLPVISSYQGDLRSIINDYGIGCYYSPGNVDELSECVKKIYDDPALRVKMSENANNVYAALFDPDKIYEEYAVHVEAVVLKKE